MEAYRWRLFCITGNKYVETPGYMPDQPTHCPNNIDHEISDDPDKFVIIDTLADHDVKIIDVADAVKMPSQEIDFPQRTGHNVFHKGYNFLTDPEAPEGKTEHEAGYAGWMKLQGISFRLGDTVCEGSLISGDEPDYLEIEIVDVNGVTGYPPGTVLARFAETFFVWKNREFIRICKDAKDIPPSVVIRTRYVAGGTEKVRVWIEHVLRTS